MFGNIFKSISKVFGGNKTERDLQNVKPIIEKINEFYEQYHQLSNDELRNKTSEFVDRIQSQLSQFDARVAEIREKLNHISYNDVENRSNLFSEIDEIEKERNSELEKVLDDLLPEAFATVKQAAKRFTENASLQVTATDLDIELAGKKPNVKIANGQAVYANEWTAAGGNIKWNMVHYDVQLIGGWSLHKGKISEMATGEGKTLVSTLPAYLNALAKRGVHLVTVNDYLARRDCEWNGPLFNFLGLRVDCLEYHQPNSSERRNAYLADITYGTNNEFGFDYLRDNMVSERIEQVQRVHHFAMVDEVDSVLIDDARTPLIISGPTPQGDDQQYDELKPRIARLVDAQKKYFNILLNDAKKLISEGKEGSKEGEGGLALLRAHRALPKNSNLIKFLGQSGMRALLTKTESYYLQDQQKEMPKADAPLYFTIDEKTNTVDLTDKGLELITGAGEDPHFFVLPDVGSSIVEIEKSELGDAEKLRAKDVVMREFALKSDRIHSVQQLLKAYTMFERDVDYIIDSNKVKIVDEQTGRVLEGRRYSDGLHQAIEAKENVKIEAATQTYATITLQNYFRMYHKLCGMTGTAETEAQEFWDIYKMGVMPIPTNKTVIRKDNNDLVYKTKREKYYAIIDEIVALSNAGRPVLVGTTDVAVSELISKMLTMKKIKHNVLNAKQHQREAEIVAEAGLPGAVTIATNMAGRGTDIKINDQVKVAGGLAIIGSERHDSRRVDRQLRGRAGRQGDPGSSRFYVSLEDDLMRVFGAERVSKLMDRFGYKEGDVIEHSWMTSTIEKNQKRMEQNHFGQRKRLLEYDDVMNKQRTSIYTMRRNALEGDKLSIDLQKMLMNWCIEQIGAAKDGGNYESLEFEVLKTVAAELPFDENTFNSSNETKLSDMLFDSLLEKYQNQSNKLAEDTFPVLKQIAAANPNYDGEVFVPFSDGKHEFQVGVNLKQAIIDRGSLVSRELEKFVTLHVIDDEWKEHLRELDELKQSVQNATYEQKDPLLIYKIESFELFGAMLNRLNTRVLEFLFRSEIANKDLEERRETRRKENSRVKAGRDENMGVLTGGGNQYIDPSEGQEEKIPQMPIKSEPKIGRNEPCFCGSGKKFKHCHGKE